MNYWKKYQGDWCVACATLQEPGASVTVTNRAGDKKSVTLGERVAALGFVYKVAAQAKPEAQNVGALDGVLALFAQARLHIKYPALVLAVPTVDAEGKPVVDFLYRISVAGPGAQVPGSLTVLDGERTEEGRDWLGRVLLDGTYEPSRKANGRSDKLAAHLRALAADPVNVAQTSAKLTGRCIFCNTALTDARSTAVGYGATCAAHWGMPWGGERHSFKAETTERR